MARRTEADDDDDIYLPRPLTHGVFDVQPKEYEMGEEPAYPGPSQAPLRPPSPRDEMDAKAEEERERQFRDPYADRGPLSAHIDHIRELMVNPGSPRSQAWMRELDRVVQPGESRHMMNAIRGIPRDADDNTILRIVREKLGLVAPGRVVQDVQHFGGDRLPNEASAFDQKRDPGHAVGGEDLGDYIYPRRR